MSYFAGRILMQMGNIEGAHEIFLKKAASCVPPLDDRELRIIWHSAVGFYTRISASPGCAPSEAHSAGDFLYKPTDASDVGEARMLALVFRDRLRYSPATDFIVYNGDIWEESVPSAHALMHELTDMQLAEATSAAIAAYKVLSDNGVAELLKTRSKKKAVAEMDEAQEQAYRAYLEAKNYELMAGIYRQAKNINSALQEVRPVVMIQTQELDADPYLLNTPGCAYDLRRGLDGAIPHASEHFVTKMTAVQPDDVGRDIWDAALNTFFCGDQELIHYVQMVAGMIAVGKVFVEALIIAYGDGRNGKSMFWNSLARVLGTYSGSISADALTVGCKRNVKPELAEARGKRMLIASELEEGTRLSTSIVKQLCSTDSITAEKKYKDPFTFEPTHTTVLYTNHLPKIGGKDAGIWRRLIVIPFEAKIEGESDIKNYTSHLYQNAGGAILSWIIEGAAEVIRRDFKIPLPECVQRATNRYREENDWLGHFLSECCEIGEGLQVKSGDLYAAYKNYCWENGEHTKSTTDFYNALLNDTFVREKTRTGNYIKGLMLSRLDDAESESQA